MVPLEIQAPAATASKAQAPPPNVTGRLFWRQFLIAARIVRVRLRFIIVFAVIFLVVGERDLLRNYWDKWTRSANRLDTTGHAVSLDTEYFCPMDPGVVSDWSGKCGICNMTLVRRKKGEMMQLPDGVVARMQFSPYRVQLAGIQTSLVSYRPLARRIEAVGYVSNVDQSSARDDSVNARVQARVFERDIPFVVVGQRAEITCESILTGAIHGTVGEIDLTQPVHSGALQVPIDLEKPPRTLRAGMTVVIRVNVPAANIDPFRSMSRAAPAIEPGSPREVFVCSEHPDVLKTRPGDCPFGKNRLELRALAENERVQWWCPMHPNVVSDAPGAECRQCNGMKLLPRVTAFTPVGEVLAVPESAVIDTGTRKVVYVERSRGMFEGIEVLLGPRCGEFFPVIQGVEAGQRVAATGAFLIDAETRLNPAASASYFGAASSGAKQ
jgi:membrane fusion protein, copper/silver efflux system